MINTKIDVAREGKQVVLTIDCQSGDEAELLKDEIVRAANTGRLKLHAIIVAVDGVAVHRNVLPAGVSLE